jgi:hypothetical protein
VKFQTSFAYIFAYMFHIVCVYRKAGLDPTGNTYAALMCGLAEKGDLAGIKKVNLCHLATFVLICSHCCNFTVYNME